MNPVWKLRGMRYLLMFALSAAAIVLVVISQPEKSAELIELAPSRVVVDTVARRALYPEVVLVGRLQPSARSALHAELAGRVVERLVEPGARVAAGQPLLRLDSGDYQDALALAEAVLEQEQAAVRRDRQLLTLARQNSELAEAEVTRLETLSNAALASQSNRGSARQGLLQLQQEVARLEYANATAKARLAQRRAELARAERALARCELRAPFAGRVNQVGVQPGDYLTSNMLAVELVDTERLDLYAEVDGATAAALTLGQPVAVVFDDQRVSGELVALQPDPNAQTHTHALRIRLPGDGLRPGQLASVELQLPPRAAQLVVPVTALLRQNGGAWVYEVGADAHLVRRPVVLGERVDGQVEIRSGVSEGARIVARDVAALADGQQVVVIDAANGE